MLGNNLSKKNGSDPIKVQLQFNIGCLYHRFDSWNSPLRLFMTTLFSWYVKAIQPQNNIYRFQLLFVCDTLVGDVDHVLHSKIRKVW